ncbi:MAG: Dam family site-specific DNA-(adenine-N6)-methyltransferase [Gemmatimonas sp.]|nr:Dam family site-specific DNA-(adenine-N6)-methyltransferase [Gemmatimonas sp.]
MSASKQNALSTQRTVAPFKSQLLKWVGNKQRFAHEIVSFFPVKIRTYYEPFIGSGAILGTLAPARGVAGDALKPLIEIWQTLTNDRQLVVDWYTRHWNRAQEIGKKEAFEEARQSYNRSPNGADLLFISRTCYGGVLRFRANDGGISTPCGAHEPISPDSFEARALNWADRVRGTTFIHSDFEALIEEAGAGDVVYCDPPYSDSQSILYGAQRFSLPRLLNAIDRAKTRGATVVLSIDGSKRSGKHHVPLDIPEGLFEREVYLDCGRSMLKRFQMKGETLEQEMVTDRLLITK